MTDCPCKVTMDTRPTIEVLARIVAATARQCGLGCAVVTGGGIDWADGVSRAERRECARVALSGMDRDRKEFLRP